jgi:hypothetical protein
MTTRFSLLKGKNTEKILPFLKNSDKIRRIIGGTNRYCA